MTLQQKISDSVMDSVYYSVNKSVRYTVWASVNKSVNNSTYAVVYNLASGPITNSVANKLKTYDFTTKNK